MILTVIDMETTGMPPDAAVVEIGWQEFATTTPASSVADLRGKPWSMLVNPGRHIPPEASAIHHIIDDDVRDARTAEYVLDMISAGTDIWVAHNAAFERSFFSGNGKPWLCTLKAARRIWPDAPSHALQVLRYWLNLPVDRVAASPPHRAAPDALVTAILLRTLMQNGATINQMIEWTEQPSLLPRVTFGKHRGLKWSEVDDGYLEWMLKQDFDEDVLYTANHELMRRQEEAA